MEATALERILACPDCRGELRSITGQDSLLGFGCDTCRLVYAVTDGIPILLATRDRNGKLEHPLVENIQKSLPASQRGRWAEHVARTLKTLDAGGAPSWAWEDEEHWSKEYERTAASGLVKRWTYRTWQREFLSESLLAATSLGGKVMLDCGCGEGQNFRHLLAEHAEETTLYVAADISLAGLKLNRSRNPHDNSLYVLCTVDDPPFRDETMDIICCFGILHHTQGKEGCLAELARLLREGGHMILHEPLDRPRLLPDCFRRETAISAHEESVDWNGLKQAIRDVGCLETVASKLHGTPLMTGLIRYASRIVLASRRCYQAAALLDELLLAALGHFLPPFRPGAVKMHLRKVPPAHSARRGHRR